MHWCISNLLRSMKVDFYALLAGDQSFMSFPADSLKLRTQSRPTLQNRRSQISLRSREIELTDLNCVE